MDLSHLFLICSLISTTVAQKCYWPAGNEATNLLPCAPGPNKSNSACCYETHYCLPNGLCYEPTSMTMYRAGCTDKSLKSQSCADYCYGSSAIYGVSGGTHSGVWACSNNKFACDLSLCGSKNFTVKGATILDNTALRADLGNTTATTTTAATCSATRAPSEEQFKEYVSTTGGVSTGGAVGIGVGVGIPLALAAASFAVLWLRERRKTKTVQSEKQSEVASTGAWSSTQYAPLSPFQGRNGSGLEPPRSEIMGTPRHELDS